VQLPDVFGNEDRFEAISAVLAGQQGFENGVDLGGHSGYFSLSLVDSNLLGRSTVYDLNPKALAVGRAMAARMGLADRVDYVEKAVDLQLVRRLPPADLVICLNLIHHAGAMFDIEDVKARGWSTYARDWLVELRGKSRVALLGAGFKGRRPLHWDAEGAARPRRFCQLVQEAGWTVAYDANVEDIHKLGVAAANGRRTRGTSAPADGGGALLDRVVRKLRGAPRDGSQRAKYHLFILK
jgi:hypothetical protein